MAVVDEKNAYELLTGYKNEFMIKKMIMNMKNDNNANVIHNNKKRIGSKVTVVLLICLLLEVFQIGFPINMGSSMNVDAANGKDHKSRAEIMSDLREWCDTIVFVQSICWDGEKEIYQTKNYTGVVFNADSAGTYLLTSDEGLEFTNEEIEKLRKKYSIGPNEKIYTKIEVVWNGDLTAEAAIVGESTQRNVAILKLNQNVSFTHVPKFSNTSINEKDVVWLLKYPQDMKRAAHISSDDVTLSMTKATKCYDLEENAYYNLDVLVEDQSTGGPVFNNNGEISGFFIKTGGEYRTITTESLCKLLDSYNVLYLRSENVVAAKLITIKHIILGVILFVLIAVYIKRRMTEKGDGKKVSGGLSGQKRGNRPSASVEYIAGNRISNIIKDYYVIGRSEDCDLCMKDKKGISRRHATIIFDGKDFYLEDMNSKNGTSLNGSPLVGGRKVLLTSGDRITVGEEDLLFKI